MPRINDIVNYLTARDLVTRVVWGARVTDDAEVRGVRADQEASTGDLSWLSQRAASTEPARMLSFRGTLLICEVDPPQPPTSAVLIISHKPKYALTVTVNEFFAYLTDTEWPAGGATIHPTANVSSSAVLQPGVVIGAHCTIAADVWIGPNTSIANASIARGVRIGAGCAIGLPGFGLERSPTGEWTRFPHLGRVLIEEGVEIGSNTCIDRGALGDTRIGRGACIDNLVHISHNVIIGDGALVIAHAMIGGSAQIGANAWVAPSAAVKNQITVGADATIGMGAVVIRDVTPGATVVGNPAKPLSRS